MSAAALAVVLALALTLTTALAAGSIEEKVAFEDAGAEEDMGATPPGEPEGVNTVILSKSINGPVPGCESADIVMVCSVPSKSPR